MELGTWWAWITSALGAAVLIIASLALPFVRSAVGNYVAGLVQHHFDDRIERLRSELRRNEEQFAADIRANERRIGSLTDTALSLQSSRQEALSARRLQAIEKIWNAKIATDRWKLIASMMSSLNLEKVFKAAEEGDRGIQAYGQTLANLAGDYEEGLSGASALSERPFVSADLWALFWAYQRVIITSVVIAKSLAMGTTQYLKKEDIIKPTMLSVLPEYSDFIEKHGFAGYYNLLDIIEQKLLGAISEMLDGRALDEATVRRSSEIMEVVQKIEAEKLEIPSGFQAPEIPAPYKDQA